MSLESAIPQYLQKTRSIPAKTPLNYEPPFPAYCARFPQTMKDMVMAIIGSQHLSPTSDREAAIRQLLSFAQDSNERCRPRFVDFAGVKDPVGAYNQCIIAYWADTALYREWSKSSGFAAWWESLDPVTEDQGWFLEVFMPPIERFETVFSDNTVPEGVAHMRESVSGALQEHVYWGSMRDRLPASQDNTLASQSSNGEYTKPSDPTQTRVRVPGRQNLAVIRSGQDWSNTYPEERTLYLDTMHPVLKKGMDFLRDEGAAVGCYDCRFMDVLDLETPNANTDKTFGLAFFDDLASLEAWSKEHKTHLDIFGGFLQYAKKLNNHITLRLFHEVLVLESHQQFFEYVGCHSQSGMLRSLKR